MRDLIKRLLKEYDSDGVIQRVEFDGFSDPILIPQYNMYLVKFLGTGKYTKVSDIEKIQFRSKEGKEYTFNADDVQKTGGSPFYISLDTLRKYYDIKFKDDFVKQQVELSTYDYGNLLNKAKSVYSIEGKCNNPKCQEFRNTIEESLKSVYETNYGTFSVSNCPTQKGFINIFPINYEKDNNGNLWSKLNFMVSNHNIASSLLIGYIKKYGTFEHNDFIQWIKDEKDNLFKGSFFDLMLRNLNLPEGSSLISSSLFKFIKRKFPNARKSQSYCPSNDITTPDLMILNINGKDYSFQPVLPKVKRVMKLDDKYYIFFGRRTKAPSVNRRADYIVVPDGPIFENKNVIAGTRSWEFSNPPIYYELEYELVPGKNRKIK